jgi:hypothetical protein
MSRSGYSYDCDNLQLYRGTVERAIKGQRGQAFLRELATAMDAMPEKILIEGDLIDETGCCCAIGVVCKSRNIDVSKIDPYEPGHVGKVVGISQSMAAEIAYMNDEYARHPETPSDRWTRVRKWVAENLIADALLSARKEKGQP